MTQVSVERLFSAMKFIYSDLRGNLSPELVQDILIIRCNDLYCRIDKKKNNQRSTRKKRVNYLESSDEE